MKTFIFLVTFFFVLIAYALEQNKAWDAIAPIIAFFLAILVLKFFKFEIVEEPSIQMNWVKTAILLGILSAGLKLFLILVVFEYQIEASHINLEKLLHRIFMFMIFMPLLEEFIFRGILFDDLKKKLGITLTIFITSIIFIGLHLHKFADDEVLGHVFAMIPGVFIYNYLKVKTNNFIPSFLAHATHNTITYSFVTLSFRTINY